MSMVRNGHSCVWSSGTAGSIVGRNRLSHGIQKELADAVHEVLEQGSINLYMFHGGTKLWLHEWLLSSEGLWTCHKLRLMTTMPFWMKKAIQLPNTMAVKKMMANTLSRVPAVGTLTKRVWSWMLFH